MNDTTIIHSTAIVGAEVHIGDHSRIWAYTHIFSGAVIGNYCNICDYVLVENNVRIGDRVTVKSGVQLWNGVILEDDVFIGPNVTFTNDLFPRSKQYLDHDVQTIVRKGASLGANSTILAGSVIGANAMVGAGSVVTRDVPPYAIVVGNPARIKGYVSADWKQPLTPEKKNDPLATINVKGVKICYLPKFVDMRGNLSFAEYEKHLPFIPKRYFIVFDVPTAEVRGEHAHRALHQFLVCVKGSCSVVVDDGEFRAEVLLDEPNKGLYLPPMIWATQYNYSSDAVLLVLASDVYDNDDYIRDYDCFIRELRKTSDL